MVIFRALNGIGSHISTDVGRSGRVFGTTFWHVEASHVLGLTVAYLHCRFGEEPDHASEGRISSISDGLGEGLLSGPKRARIGMRMLKPARAISPEGAMAEQFNGQVQLLIARTEQDYRQPPGGWA